MAVDSGGMVKDLDRMKIWLRITRNHLELIPNKCGMKTDSFKMKIWAKLMRNHSEWIPKEYEIMRNENGCKRNKNFVYNDVESFGMNSKWMWNLPAVERIQT